MFTIGAFAIIFDDQWRVLLCRRRDMDVWNLPGGGVESGELPAEAVLREVKEETGLEVVVDRLTGVYGKNAKNELIFAFLCIVTGGELAPTAEASESRYFEFDKIPPNTVPKHIERICDAVNFNGKPIFRRQTAQSVREMLENTSR